MKAYLAKRWKYYNALDIAWDIVWRPLLLGVVAVFAWGIYALSVSTDLSGRCQQLGYPESAWWPSQGYCIARVGQTDVVVTLEYAQQHPLRQNLP